MADDDQLSPPGAVSAWAESRAAEALDELVVGRKRYELAPRQIPWWARLLRAFARLLSFGRHERGDGWTLQPWRAHRRARQLLTQPWLWSHLDRNAPFGRPAGSEVLEAWRLELADHPEADAVAFLERFTLRWSGRPTPQEWWVRELPSYLAPYGELLGPQHVRWQRVCWVDETTLGLTLAALVLQGAVPSELVRRARVCLARQAGQPLIEAWNPEWQVRCRWLEEVLQDLQQPEG